MIRNLLAYLLLGTLLVGAMLGSTKCLVGLVAYLLLHGEIQGWIINELHERIKTLKEDLGRIGSTVDRHEEKITGLGKAATGTATVLMDVSSLAHRIARRLGMK